MAEGKSLVEWAKVDMGGYKSVIPLYNNMVVKVPKLNSMYSYDPMYMVLKS
jgi:hypothetical protein